MPTNADSNLADIFWLEMSRFRDTRWRKQISQASWFDVTEPLAALIYLRLADFEESERRAVSEFDGVAYSPAVPEPLRWSRLRVLRGRDLAVFFHGQLLPRLRAGSPSPLGQRLARIAPSLELEEDDVPVLETLIEFVDRFDVGSPKGKAEAREAFEAILIQSVNASQRSEFFTPAPIVDLMVKLANPQLGDRVYDPCFGMGGLLRAAVMHMAASSKLGARDWHALQERSVYGVEINPSAYTIALARLALAGVREPGLELGDALERPSQKLGPSERFDVVLASPPWGMVGRISDSADYHYRDRAQFRVRSKDSENLFLQHAIGCLRPGGRAVIALPEGTLFRPGADRQVREILLHEFRVDGVISLPAGAFAPFSAIKANLLVFRREEPAKSVRFTVVRSLSGLKGRFDGRMPSPAEVVERFRSSEQDSDAWNTPVAAIQRRDAELVAKRPADDDLERSLRSLVVADPELRVAPLNDIAELIPGVSYGRDSARETIGVASSWDRALIRVADLRDSMLSRPRLYLTEDAFAKSSPRQRVHPGDVVLTTSGSIGKVAVVQREHVGAVASKSVVILRSRNSSVSGEYLGTLLRAESYQQWFTNAARGSTIQHLSSRTLAHLRVPVPALQVQQHVVERSHRGDGDAFLALLQVVKSGLVHSRAALDAALNPLRQVRNRIAHEGGADRATQLDTLARVYCNHEVAEDDPADVTWFTNWMAQMKKALSLLQGVKDVARGPGLYAILQAPRLGVQTAIEQLQSQETEIVDPDELQILKNCRDLTLAPLALIDGLSDDLLADVQVEATLSPSSVAAGKPADVTVRLSNRGVLPLRNVIVRSRPPVGSRDRFYLGERDTTNIALSLPPVDATEPKSVPLTIAWTAERLDGSNARGEVPLVVEVRPVATLMDEQKIGSSPYIVGDPISSRDMFFGRQDVLKAIQTQLTATTHANVILLEGNRRTGKSSVLERLRADAPQTLPGWVVAYCNFQGATGHQKKLGLTTNEVFRFLARQIGWALIDRGLNAALPGQVAASQPLTKAEFTRLLPTTFAGENPVELFELYLQNVLAAVGQTRLLVLLDEFEKIQEGIEAGITSSMVPENFRYLLHTYPRFCAILAGAKRLRRLRQNHWSALFGLGHRIEIGAIPEDAARELVTRPAEGSLVFVPQARDAIVNRCACQPYLIQCLCNHIWISCARRGDRSVTLGVVEEMARSMIHDNEHFQTLWDQFVETDRQRFILLLCQRLSNGPDPVTLKLIETHLEDSGVPVRSISDLGDDLMALRELELLLLVGQGASDTYRINVPLMAEWIAQHKDFEDQRRRALREAEELG